MRPLAWALIITTLAARATGHLHDDKSGWRDRRARHTLRAYAHKHVGAHRDRDPATGLRTNWTTPDLRVRSCHVQEHVDGPFRPTYYVAPPHDATQAHRQRPPNFIAPFCGPGRRTALE